jgi:flagella basal body P-ring formation protein FlgA
VVGGLLVALSAVGIFAGYLGATGDDRRPYVVATSDLAVGHRITAADLAVVRIDLPPALHRVAHDRPGPLVGAVVLGPVGRGELLQNSDISIANLYARSLPQPPAASE